MQKQHRIRTSYGNMLRRYLLLALTIAVLAAMLLLNSLHKTTALSAWSSASDAPYYASILDGRIAIYARGQKTPALLTDTPVSSLPESDRKALRSGIGLSSKEALARFLEDYTS